MVAVAGTFGFLHLPQKSIHFRQRQQAPGAHCTLAGHAGEKLVARCGQQLRDAMFAQFAQERACQRGRVGGLQQDRNATHRELSWTHRREIETELPQCRGVFFGGGDVDRFGIEHRGNQQRLRRQSLLVECVFELLVQDAVVRRMHGDDHQTLVVLRQDVDAVQLREGITKRRCFGFGGWRQ